MSLTIDTSIAASSAPRTWASTVKGSESLPVALSPALEADAACIRYAKADHKSFPVQPPSTPAALVPAARGRRQCWCRGEVLAMLGHFGWLLPWDEIDHPDLGRNGGHIYINANDIVDGIVLTVGDTVVFNLYADRRGLGAESCKLEQRSPTNLNASAPEFMMPSSMRGNAEVFEPSGHGCVPDSTWNVRKLLDSHDDPDGPVNLNAVQALLAINPAFLLDDSDSDDDDDDDSDKSVGRGSNASPSNEKECLQRFLRGSGGFSLASESTGVSSESEDDARRSTPARSISPPPGLVCMAKLSVVPPPGLVWPCASPQAFQKGAFAPPPGLSLPVAVPVLPASWFQ